MGSAIAKLYKSRCGDVIDFSHEEVDISDTIKINSIFKKYKPDIIINCAAIAGNAVCEENKDLAIKVNSDAVLNLARLCHKYDCTFIHLSTSGVFGDNTYHNEEEMPYPNTLYESTKLLGEKHIINNCHKYYIFRLPLLFGNPYNRGIFNNLVLQVKEGKPIKASVNHIYSYGYNKDMAEYIYDISNNYSYGIYHIYNTGCCSVYDFLKYFKKISKSKSSICKFISDDNGFSVMNTNKQSLRQRHFKETLKDIKDDI